MSVRIGKKAAQSVLNTIMMNLDAFCIESEIYATMCFAIGEDLAMITRNNRYIMWQLTETDEILDMLKVMNPKLHKELKSVLDYALKYLWKGSSIEYWIPKREGVRANRVTMEKLWNDAEGVVNERVIREPLQKTSA